MSLEYQKTPPNRLEARIYGQRVFRTIAIGSLLAALVNAGLGVATGAVLYYVVAAVMLVPVVALRKAYKGGMTFVEKGKGKVVLRPGVSEKGVAKQVEWPENEVTEARMTVRQTFVGKDKENRYLIGLTRRSLRPTQLIEVPELDEAIEFGVRLSRLLKCELVDATVQPPVRFAWEEAANLRKKLSGEVEEGERVARPGSLERRRKGQGYEFRWKRQNSRGLTTYMILAALMILGPVYAFQVTYLLWPFLLWLPGIALGYLAVFEWVTIYSLMIEPTGITFVDGKRANEPYKIRWEQMRGMRRIAAKGGAEHLELRTAKPIKIYCTTKGIAAYLEEQLSRAAARYGAPAPTGGRTA